MLTFWPLSNQAVRRVPGKGILIHMSDTGFVSRLHCVFAPPGSYLLYPHICIYILYIYIGRYITSHIQPHNTKCLHHLAGWSSFTFSGTPKLPICTYASNLLINVFKKIKTAKNVEFELGSIESD